MPNTFIYMSNLFEEQNRFSVVNFFFNIQFLIAAVILGLNNINDLVMLSENIPSNLFFTIY